MVQPGRLLARSITGLLPVLLVAAACVPQVTFESMYDPDRVVRIEIEMDPDDWDALRLQAPDHIGRAIEGTCLDGPHPRPYTYFTATVTVDGVRLRRVGIRKKGNKGSLTAQKPSLKIKFHEYASSGRLGEIRRLTLNNSKQDPAYVRQCLAFDVFRRAGVPAPRCNFAHVTVNGEPLGVYANVEPTKNPFLRMHFGRDDGRLYKGQGSDFRHELLQMFEFKGDEADEDRSDLRALADALRVDDPDLLPAIEPLVDLDRFFALWAVEVLIGSFDGYTNSLNNFHVYADPETGRMTILPRSPDGTFIAVNPEGDDEMPVSVFASSVLPHRLYGNPQTRARYVATMERLLAEVWDEDELAGSIDAMAGLIEPHMAQDGLNRFSAAIESFHAFVAGRRGLIEEELVSPPDWNWPLTTPVCQVLGGTVEGTFHAAWNPDGVTGDSLESFSDGEADLSVEGPLGPVLASLGATSGPADGGAPQIGIAVVALGGSEGVLVLYVAVDAQEAVPGAVVPIDHNRAFSYLVTVDLSDPYASARVVGDVAGGSIRFDEVEPWPDGWIAGVVDSPIMVRPPPGD